MLDFSNSGFIPHGHCYLWQPTLVWLHLVSDSLTAVASYAILVSLVYFVRRRQDFPFKWVFWFLGAFMVMCGTTYLLDVWTLWYPIYWVSGVVKLLTAFVAVATGVMLYRCLPAALALPSWAQVEVANTRLQAEVAAHAQTEAALRASKAQLRETQRIARMGSWEYDVLTQAVTWSEEMFRLFGLSPLPVPPHATRLQCYEPESQVQLEQAVQAALADGTPYALELQCTPPDGTTRWFLKRGEAVRDAAGKVVKLVGTVLDLTDRKQQERMLSAIALRLHQAQTLPTILDTSVAAVQQCLGADRVVVYQFAPDMSGHIVAEAVQPRWSSLLHVQLEDTCFRENLGGDYQRGKTRAISNIQDAGLSDCHRELLERFQVQANLVVPLLLTEPVVAADTVATAATLPQLWGLLIVHQCAATRPWQPSETALLQQVAVHMGIALQQAELSHHLQQLNQTLEARVEQRTEALQQQLSFESLLKQITEQVRDSLDEAQSLQAAVTALGQGLGVDCCDTGLYDLTQHHSTVTYEYTTAALPSAVGKVLTFDHQSGVYDQLLQGQTLQFCWVGTGALRSVTCSHAILACPLQDERSVLGELWLFRAHGEAFSEPEVRLVQQVANQCAIAVRQARLYADSQEQLQVLEQLNRLKDDFVSTVSHELRTPLASIKMATHMLSLSFEHCKPPFATAYGRALAEKVGRYLTILATECERELTLVNDLLSLQRLESGAVDTEWSTVNVLPWLSELVPVYAARAQSRQQTLQLQVPASLPSLRSNVSLLTSVWRELLTNACKYTPSGGVIRVQGSATETSVQVSVSNTGIAIPPEELPHLCEKFYRSPSRDQWQQGGTGLGLALVKSQVERLGGALTVTSDAAWTVFSVSLPLAPQHDAQSV